MPRTRQQAVANLDVHFRRLREDAVYRAKWRYNIARANRSPERRAKSSATARAVNARRVRCEECGMVSSPGAIGRHQNRTGHTGRSLIESSQERGRRGGLRSGAYRARRCAEDPEYRSFISATVRASITDEQRARSSAQMLAMQKVRWRCECGMESTPGGIGRHMKATGHTTKRRI